MHSILPGKQISLTMLYLQVQSICPDLLVAPKDFVRNYLRKMITKNLLLEIKTNYEPLYTLTDYGLMIRNYFFPLCNSHNKETTIFVLPKTAAKELGYSVTSISKKRIKLYYVTIAKKLYVLKKVTLVDILKKIPSFPIVLDLSQLINLFPDPYRSLLPLFKKTRHKKGWFWPEIFEYLITIGNNNYKMEE